MLAAALVGQTSANFGRALGGRARRAGIGTRIAFRRALVADAE